MGRRQLVGRTGELERLDQLIADARAGVGRLAVLVGPAGIGKSAVVAEAVQCARAAGFQVLAAVGELLERDFGFGVVRQLFFAIVASAGGPSEWLSGAAELAAAPLGIGQPAGAGIGAVAGIDPSGAMHGLYWLTARLADRSPTMIVVDDAHWADGMSGRFLAYLARRLDGLPVLVLVASRPASQDGDLDFLAQLEALPEATVIRPAPLTEPQTGELIVGRAFAAGVDQEFAAACHQATGGNPFLLGALLTRLREDGATGSADDVARVGVVTPEDVIRWVRRRLRSHSGAAAALAGAYAVLDSGASLDDAAAISGLDPATVPAVADILIEAEILTPAHPHDFVHPLVRAAIYDSLPPAQRADAHLHAARLTLAHDGPPALIAAHLLASEPGRRDWTVEALRRAARDAVATGAPGSAALYLRRALRESIDQSLRAELLVELGEAQINAGSPDGFGSLRAAIELQPAGRRRAETNLRLGRSLFASGDYIGGREAFMAGLGEELAEDDDLYLELSAWSVTDTRSEPDLRPSVRMWMQRLVAESRPGQSRTERLLLAQLAYRASRTGERSASEVASLARRALADGALLRDCVVDYGPHGAACSALRAADETATALEELDSAILASQRRGSRPAVGWFSMLRAVTHYGRGQMLEALADIEQAAAAARDVSGTITPAVLAVQALCLIQRDDVDGAEQALRLSEEEQQRLPKQPSSTGYYFALGRLRFAQGNFEQALEIQLRCRPWVELTNTLNPAGQYSWRSQAALAALALGRVEVAHEVFGDTLERARAFGAARTLGIALRTTALIDRGGQRIDLLDEAIALFESSGAELLLAGALTDKAAALRAAGRSREALEPLRRALDLGSHCGGLAVARRARSELVSAGARPRRERLSGLDALTPTEIRVARLAAEQKKNAQIAQSLYVGLRTVETHLTNIYRKLDIRREELPQLLAADGRYV